MTYLYYHQNRNPAGLRRYEPGSERGEKWEPAEGRWVPQCGPRAACLQSGDRLIDRREAELLFPGSTR